MAVVAAVAGVLAGGAAWRAELPRNFGVVQKDALYRSGQPTGWHWNTLIEDYRIRTVIDLRQPEPDAPWSAEQDRLCRQRGLKLVHIPLGSAGARDAPTPREWQTFLDVVRDPSNWPVLVHCEVGTARTGVMVGGYRIAVQGWDFDATLHEARERYFNDETHPEYVEFWKDLAKARTTRPSGG